MPKAAAPKSFWIIAIMFLAWNLMGVAAYWMQSTADLTALARTDPYTAQIWREMPSWAWAAYAIAVGVGTLATLTLMARRGWVVPLYAISLAAVLIQFGYTFFGTDIIAVKGVAVAMGFPIFIIVMAVVQLLYACTMKRRAVIG